MKTDPAESIRKLIYITDTIEGFHRQVRKDQDNVHVYLGMVSKMGSIACNSLYLGTVTATQALIRMRKNPKMTVLLEICDRFSRFL